MTKAELLAELAAFPWVNHLNGSPILLDTLPDGSNVYSQNLLDVAQDTGIYRNIQFYVYQEGLGGELALYKEAIPQSLIANANEVLKSEVLDQLLIMFPDKVFTVTIADDKTKSGVIQTFLDDPGDNTKDIVAGFTYVQAVDKTLTLTQINETADIILQLGSRNSVSN